MMLSLVLAACVSVAGPKITAQDLAQAVPAFVPAHASAAVGYTPAPGVQRMMHAAELRGLLRQQGFETESALKDVCFQRPVSALKDEDVAAAMRATLGDAATVEVVEVSKLPVPAGELVFPREQIGMPPVALWRGYVRYDETSKFPVWARVKIAVPSTRVKAAEDLRPGVAIQAWQVRVESEAAFPDKRTTPESVLDAVGCIPRRLIPAQTPLWKDAIEPPLIIARGDKVTVAVRAGLARLSVVAEAEADGRRGDLIALKNLESGKTFRARVESPGRAAVDGNAGKP